MKDDVKAEKLTVGEAIQILKDFTLPYAVERATDVLINAINDDGWVSVDERLPDEEGKYLVGYKNQFDLCSFVIDEDGGRFLSPMTINRWKSVTPPKG